MAVTEPVPLYLTEACGLVNRTPSAFSEAVEEGEEVSPRTPSTTSASGWYAKAWSWKSTWRPWSPATPLPCTNTTASRSTDTYSPARPWWTRQPSPVRCCRLRQGRRPRLRRHHRDLRLAHHPRRLRRLGHHGRQDHQPGRGGPVGPGPDPDRGHPLHPALRLGLLRPGRGHLRRHPRRTPRDDHAAHRLPQRGGTRHRPPSARPSATAPAAAPSSRAAPTWRASAGSPRSSSTRPAPSPSAAPWSRAW